ncbi:MAG: efflux RND transporter permease subunit, partial [Acidobacteriota bacterium]
DMDVAYREVRDRIERARRALPEDVDRVYIRKDDIDGIPVYVIGIAIGEDVSDPYDLIQHEIIQPLARVPGVASVRAEGLEEKEVLIDLDRERTEAAGLNIYDLSLQLMDDNFTLASGHVRDASRKLPLRSVARYRSLEELEDTWVSPRVRLSDIATLRYEVPEVTYRARAMSRPAVALLVLKEGQANTREVSERVQAAFDQIQRDPRVEGLGMLPLFDQGEVIDESLETMLNSGTIGGMLAFLVLMFFLRRFRLTLIVALSIPISLLIGLTVMYFGGETLNIISLLGLMICVGLLVDNSVVVAENIHRLHRAGASRREAAVRGAGEMALAITMSTLTTIVVFLPVALVEGPGQFFLMRLALPVSVSLAGSLLVALVFIPVSVYLTLPNGGAQQAARSRIRSLVERSLRRGYEMTFGGLGRAYNKALAFFLVRRLDLVIALVAVFAVTIALTRDRVEMVPIQEDEQAGFEIAVEMPVSATFEETEQWFLAAEKVIEDSAEEFGLDGWFLFHRKTGGELQGWFTRPRRTDHTPREVAEAIKQRVPKKAGIKLYAGRESEVDEESGEQIYGLKLYGEDPERLESTGKALEQLLTRVDGVLGLKLATERQPNELGLVIDRDRARRYGANPRVIAGLVGFALRGRTLPKFIHEGREIPVRIRFEQQDRDNLEQLGAFRVPTQSGALLSLSTLTDPRLLASPDYIMRENKRISRSITLELVEGQEKPARERLDALLAGVDLPEGISFAATDSTTELNEDVEGLKFAGLLSVVFIYLLMGFLFESFILPLSIILTIPLAAIGVLGVHAIVGRDIDFLGLVGIVLLIGVVVNNGIVLIDYLHRLRARGLARREAILLAAERRFRPIMMTAITTIGGLIPLAFSGASQIGISYTSFSLTLIGG